MSPTPSNPTPSGTSAPTSSSSEFILPESTASPVTITVVPRNIAVHFVTEEELEALAEGKASLYMSLFGIAIGILGTSLGTLFSTELQGNTFLAFEGLAITTGFLTVFFGIGSYREWRNIKQRVESITTRTP